MGKKESKDDESDYMTQVRKVLEEQNANTERLMAEEQENMMRRTAEADEQDRAEAEAKAQAPAEPVEGLPWRKRKRS
mgnify:CR=1 FL=1